MQNEDSIGRVLFKSFLFSIIFLFCWLFLYRPLNSFFSTEKPASSQSQTEAYDKQMQRSSALFDKSEAQMARMEKVIQMQEENATRQALVLSAWENQAGIKSKK